jgi:hypothetical protein
MNEYIGRHVKCFLRNSTVIEGIVEEWGTTIQLQSLDGQSLLIIHHPEQDIILTKVLLSEEVVEPVEELENKTFEPKPQFPLEMSEGDEELDPLTLQAKSIAELKVEMAKQERKIIADKLKDHYPDTMRAPRKVTYGYPGLFKKPSAQ